MSDAIYVPSQIKDISLLNPLLSADPWRVCTQRVSWNLGLSNGTDTYGNTLTAHPIPTAVHAIKVRYESIKRGSGQQGDRDASTPQPTTFQLRAALWVLYGTYTISSPTSTGGSLPSAVTASDLLGKTVVVKASASTNAAIITGNTGNAFTVASWSGGTPTTGSTIYIFDIYPLTFAGNRSINMEPYTVIDTDPYNIDIPAVSTIYIATNVYGATGTYWSKGTFSNDYATNLEFCQSGTGANVDMTLGGWDTVASGNGMQPTTVLGIPNDQSSFKSILGIGDSIGQANSDTNQFYRGVFGRAAQKYGLPIYNGSVSGEDTRSLNVNGMKLIARMRQAPNCTVAYVETLVNDAYNSVSVATTKSNLLAFYQQLTRQGIRYIVQRMATPRLSVTSNADAYTQLSSQTAHSSESSRVAVNQWLRDTSSSGAVAQALAVGVTLKVFNACATLESSQDSGKWAVYAPSWTGLTVVSAGSNYIITSGTLSDYAAITGTGWQIKITSGLGAVTSGVGGTTAYASINNVISSGGIRWNLNQSFSVQPTAGDTFSVYKYPTSDGVHPTGVSYDAEATALLAAGLF